MTADAFLIQQQSLIDDSDIILFGRRHLPGQVHDAYLLEGGRRTQRILIRFQSLTQEPVIDLSQSLIAEDFRVILYLSLQAVFLYDRFCLIPCDSAQISSDSGRWFGYSSHKGTV